MWGDDINRALRTDGHTMTTSNNAVHLLSPEVASVPQGQKVNLSEDERL